MTRNVTSIGRSFSTSKIQREVTQANGQAGSNQKSTVVRFGVDVTISTVALMVERFTSLAAASARYHMVRCGTAGKLPGASCQTAGHTWREARARWSDRFVIVSVPNLTRDDARVRAELLRVESYDVVLDLTDG